MDAEEVLIPKISGVSQVLPRNSRVTTIEQPGATV